ncbi:MAG: sulfurtransferase [Rhizobiaceae bacterium]|nr:sulfurtransferase [Rhizobiaceae bacterium]
MSYSKISGILVASSVAMSTSAMAAGGPLVSVDWLSANQNAVDIIDVRSKIGLKDGQGYAAGHILGAVQADYLQAGWRTARDGVVGVLPETSALEALLSSLGVANGDHVVLVSSGNTATDFGSAARVYWTLKQLGHDKVSILEGGQKAWEAAGKSLSTTAVVPQPATYKANVVAKLNVSLEEVKANYRSSDVQVLDGRPVKQYVGDAKHPKAARAGRIPQSVNLDNHNFFKKDSASLLNKAALTKIASVVSDDKPVISYCNTGHWASTNWFVLSELLGKKNVRVYDGSMVEWSAKKELPIATGESATN